MQGKNLCRTSNPSPNVPGVAFGLKDVPGVAEGFGGSLGLDKEFRLAAQAEVVVGAPFSFTSLDDYFPLAVRQGSLVLDVPAQRLEERRNEVNPRLGFRVLLREVMALVRSKLMDKLRQGFGEGLDGGSQFSTPFARDLTAWSVIARVKGFKPIQDGLPPEDCFRTW